MLFAGISVFAKNTTETIQALYKDIKIYVDGVKINPKDANGNTVEPFIYNGTTYLPVRAVGEAIDKQVTWDGATSSVYLGEKPGETLYLMNVCPPYEVDYNSKTYLSNLGEKFEMAGKNYSDGLSLYHGGHALFNLDGKYKTIKFTIGHVGDQQYENTVAFVADDKTIKTITLEPYCMPKTVSISLNNALQLKIVHNKERYYSANCGIGNIIVK